jgi:hypothetical protein
VPARCATTFSIIRIPALPAERHDRFRVELHRRHRFAPCSIPITTPSSVSAVTTNSSGSRDGSAKIE